MIDKIVIIDFDCLFLAFGSLLNLSNLSEEKILIYLNSRIKIKKNLLDTSVLYCVSKRVQLN